MSGNIFLGKVMGGTIVVGELQDNGDFHDAVEVVVMPSGDGRSFRIGLMPFYTPFSDQMKGFSIEAHKFITEPVEASQELGGKYFEAITGISVVPAGAMPPAEHAPKNNVVRLK